MLHVVTIGAYYPPVVTTWKILTTGASYLTKGTLCIAGSCCVEQGNAREKSEKVRCALKGHSGGLCAPKESNTWRENKNRSVGIVPTDHRFILMSENV